MDPCLHKELIREVCDSPEDAPCVLCAVTELEERKAEYSYGPNFNRTKYLFDVQQKSLENLIRKTSIDEIPISFIRLMRVLSDARYIKKLSNGETTGFTTMMIPAFLDNPHNLDNDTQSLIFDPNNVPPAVGWRHMSLGDPGPDPETDTWPESYTVDTDLGDDTYELENSDVDDHNESWGNSSEHSSINHEDGPPPAGWKYTLVDPLPIYRSLPPSKWSQP